MPFPFWLCGALRGRAPARPNTYVKLPFWYLRTQIRPRERKYLRERGFLEFLQKNNIFRVFAETRPQGLRPKNKQTPQKRAANFVGRAANAVRRWLPAFLRGLFVFGSQALWSHFRKNPKNKKFLQNFQNSFLAAFFFTCSPKKSWPFPERN